jgi:two-component system nitrate/nitrite response regulator NarL
VRAEGDRGSTHTATPGRPARVFVLVPSPLYGESLRAALDGHDRIDAVGAARADRVGVAAMAAAVPDIVLMDGPADGAGEAVEMVRAVMPRAKVVALQVSRRDDEVISWAEAGAASILTEDVSLSEVVETCGGLANGGAGCCSAVAQVLLRRVASVGARDALDGPTRALTYREREIVALIDRGLSNKEIARDLQIELATVKNHVHNILRKLDVHRRGEAAARLRGAVSVAAGERGA